jgi:hypothetical protein
MRNLIFLLTLVLLSVDTISQVISYAEKPKGSEIEYIEFTVASLLEKDGAYVQYSFQSVFGQYGKFQLVNRFNATIPYYNGSGDKVSIQTGLGVNLNKNLYLTAYPFWFYKYSQSDPDDLIGYRTPISVMLKYEHSGQPITLLNKSINMNRRFSTELWLNYSNYNFYPSIRLSCSLVKIHTLK